MEFNKDIEHGYYQINNTKKILYWNGHVWMKPEKDVRGKYSGYVSAMDNQPKNVRTVTPVSETEYASLYKGY